MTQTHDTITHLINQAQLRASLAAYWHALDAGHDTEASASAICEQLRPALLRLAHRASRQLGNSALAEPDDFVSSMLLEVLTELPRLPRMMSNPAGYLVTTAYHALCDEMRGLIPRRRSEASLDAPHGQAGETWALSDLLADDDQPRRPRDAQASAQMIDLLARLRPSYQAAIQARHQFANWQPRPGRSRGLQKTNYYYRALGQLRQLAQATSK
jgi:hypothetical protein